MSDDYLFDKHGTDAEIERLESLLSAYRLIPVVPEIEGDAKAKEAGSRFRYFRFAFAAAFASLVFVIAAWVISLTYLDRSAPELSAVRPVATPEQDRIFNGAATIDPTAVDGPSTATLVEPRIATPNKNRAIKTSFRRQLRSPGTVAAKAPRLTKEEKYAYDQLMVALWITGSKLKVVQDTINRVDDNDER